MSEILNGLEGLLRESPHGPEVEFEGGALVIDCRGCDYTPVPGSDECIRCMVEAMRSEGGCDRIVLRTGKDIEVSGRAGEAIRETASIKRWSYSREKLPIRCRSCHVSRDSVMNAAWSVFPAGAVSEGHRILASDPPGKEGCEECIGRTSAALDQMEIGISKVIGMMSDSGRSTR